MVQGMLTYLSVRVCVCVFLGFPVSELYLASDPSEPLAATRPLVRGVKRHTHTHTLCLISLSSILSAVTRLSLCLSLSPHHAAV